MTDAEEWTVLADLAGRLHRLAVEMDECEARGYFNEPLDGMGRAMPAPIAPKLGFRPRGA